MNRANFDAAGFHAALDRTRVARSATWKDIAKDTGVSQSTLARMPTRRPDAASLAALSAWAGINPATYCAAPPPPPRFGADALASAIREMVKADIQGDGSRYTMHETAMREQLYALERQLKERS